MFKICGVCLCSSLFFSHPRQCADPGNFLRGGGGGGGGGGMTENFNMEKINNLAIPGWGGPDPLSPPLDLPMLGNDYTPALLCCCMGMYNAHCFV